MTEEPTSFDEAYPRQERRNRWLTVAIVVLIVAIAAAAVVYLTRGRLGPLGYDSIAEIRSSGRRFHDETVRVRGTVIETMGVLGSGFFQIDDGTGEIWVTTTQGIPSRDEVVVVEGRVTSLRVSDIEATGIVENPRDAPATR